MADKKNIDKLFKSKLDAHSRNPRPEAWDKLSANLEDEKGASRKMFWISTVSVAATLFLMLSVGGYWLQNQSGIQGGNDFANTEADSLQKNRKQKLLKNEEDTNTQMAQEENIEDQDLQTETSEQLSGSEKKSLKDSKATDKGKNLIDKNKSKKPIQEQKPKELEELAPASPQKEDKTMLANNDAPNNDKEEVFRVVVRVSLSKESKQNTQIASNKTNKKSKSKLNKVFNAIKDFKEGADYQKDSLDINDERLWASIGKK